MQVLRPACIVAGIVIFVFLMISGCRKDQATAPAAQVEAPAATTMVVPPQARAPVESPLPPASAEAPKAQVAPAEPNEAGPSVSLVLGFSPGQTATYKVTTEAEKSVDWLGAESAKPATFAAGRSGNYVEMTFEQQVEEVRDNGNAVLGITIKALKYRGEVKSKVALDFDGSRAEDQDHPLAALIGKSYRLELSPAGEVVALLDMASVRQAVGVGTPAHGVAVKLFSEEVVRDRHGVPPLSALKDSRVKPGQSWSDLRSFSFGDMGLKGYERVYTLKQVRQDDGRVALVEMEAIPSAAMAAELHKRQTAGSLAGLFDNTEQYGGRLELDLDAGRIRAYVEEMKTEWVVADPAMMKDTTAQPRGLKMGARRLHRLELLPSP